MYVIYTKKEVCMNRYSSTIPNTLQKKSDEEIIEWVKENKPKEEFVRTLNKDEGTYEEFIVCRK